MHRAMGMIKMHWLKSLNIIISFVCNYQVGSTLWAVVGNIKLKTYLEEVLEKTTFSFNRSISFPLYVELDMMNFLGEKFQPYEVWFKLVAACCYFKSLEPFHRIIGLELVWNFEVLERATSNF